MSGNRLLRSTAVFSSMTFLSRVSGLVRDQVYRRVFGASPAMEAFVVAFRIPNFMRRLFAEGSFSMAFVPVLAEYKEKRRPGRGQGTDRPGRRHADWRLLLVVTALWRAGGAVGHAGIRPGLRAGQRAVAADHGDAAHHLPVCCCSFRWRRWPAAILNSYQRFAMPALSPVLHEPVR